MSREIVTSANVTRPSITQNSAAQQVWACNTPHISPHRPNGAVPAHVDTARNGYLYTPSPEEKHVSIRQYAGRVDVHPATPPGPPAKPPPRGEVTCFSRAARRRMIQKSAEIRNVGTAAFITLTYPGFFAGDWQSVKRDIDVFSKAILRKYQDCGFMWRMEIKKRLTGASQGELVPHYHLCVVGLPNTLKWGKLGQTDTLVDWISTTWNRVVGGDEDHLRAGTNCRRVVNMRHMTSYVAKYAAKEETDDSADLWRGRRWGCRGDLHDEPGMVTTMTYQEWFELRRLIRGWAKAQGMKPATLRRLSSNPMHVIKLIGIGEDWTPQLLARMIRNVRANNPKTDT